MHQYVINGKSVDGCRELLRRRPAYTHPPHCRVRTARIGGTDKIPDFLIGHYRWKNYLMSSNLPFSFNILFDFLYVSYYYLNIYHHIFKISYWPVLLSIFYILRKSENNPPICADVSRLSLSTSSHGLTSSLERTNISVDIIWRKLIALDACWKYKKYIFYFILLMSLADHGANIELSRINRSFGGLGGNWSIFPK